MRRLLLSVVAMWALVGCGEPLEEPVSEELESTSEVSAELVLPPSPGRCQADPLRTCFSNTTCDIACPGGDGGICNRATSCCICAE
jgi:hypothetical protein